MGFPGKTYSGGLGFWGSRLWRLRASVFTYKGKVAQQHQIERDFEVMIMAVAPMIPLMFSVGHGI